MLNRNAALYSTALSLVLIPSFSFAVGELTGEMTHAKAKTPEQHEKASNVKAAKVGNVDVTVGGIINFQAGYGEQDSAAFETGGFSRDHHFANDTEIHVLVNGQADSGLKYGAVIELEADANADNRGEGDNADKTFIWTESNAGRVELGNNSGAEQTMAVNASSIARGTGGIAGDFEFYANTGGVSGGSFIITPDLPTANTGGVTEDATKVSYYTPQYNGFQFGVSYTPDEGDGGTTAGFTGDAGTDNENVFSPGVSYTKEYDGGVNVNAALVSEFGQNESSTVNDLSAWQAGIAVSKDGFSVAGSYIDYGDSGQLASSSDDASAWNIGGAYENGPWGVSVTYLDSQNADNDFTNLVVSTDYEVAEGLIPYAEVAFFDADETGTTTDNSGTVFLVGSYLNF